MNACDRYHFYDDGELQVALEGSDDDHEHGYHTPKKIFNSEMSRLSQLQIACPKFPSPPCLREKANQKLMMMIIPTLR
ncbi:hypothetical protein KIN20_021730 [Parelaphostrongylus tenuis]|uniref:Uncharacterized protein n=1 Tax=Parelaphostrongylus tenuis TaxID=148309 RepID=A0AAD5QRR5_PARTN|nr:hypothetical protein KIN20_021730 [Parelaphostrongylus tenuis]